MKKLSFQEYQKMIEKGIISDLHKEAIQKSEEILDKNKILEMGFTILEFIDYTMKKTLELKRELIFAYEKNTDLIISGLISGTDHSVSYKLGSIPIFFHIGDFHTHYDRKKPNFSLDDLYDAINTPYIYECGIGNPLMNEIIIIDIGSIKGNIHAIEMMNKYIINTVKVVYPNFREFYYLNDKNELKASEEGLKFFKKDGDYFRKTFSQFLSIKKWNDL